jgi:hypothetical protein
MRKVGKFVRLRRCLDGNKVTDFYVRPGAVIAAFASPQAKYTVVMLDGGAGTSYTMDRFMESPATVARRVQAAEGEDA